MNPMCASAAHVGANRHGHRQPGASHGRLGQRQAPHDAVGAWRGARREVKSAR